MSPFNFDNQRTHQPWERRCLTTCCDLFYKRRPSLSVAQAVVIKTIAVERGEFIPFRFIKRYNLVVIN